MLGMHVLALDATIVAVPAAPDGPRPASPRPPSRPPALTGPRPWRGAPGRGELRLIGGSLARAERFLDEGRTSLADVELVRCRRR